MRLHNINARIRIDVFHCHPRKLKCSKQLFQLNEQTYDEINGFIYGHLGFETDRLTQADES